jgi:adenosylcobinamide-GDP ribazoletransferase
MRGEGADPDGGERHPLRCGVTCLRLAVSFLTILPAGPRRPSSGDELAASFGLFPLVGFIVGAALALEDRALMRLFNAGIRSGLIVLTLVIITGALHLDALADTADALAAGGDRERALSILRDTRVGVFGVVAILFWLGLQWAALASIQGRPRATAIFLAPGLGRWAMVAVASGLDYLREAGAGSFMKPQWIRSNFWTATAIAVLAIIPVLSWHVLAAAISAIAVALVVRWFYRRWVGGVTGDLIGAAGALSELAVMLAMAARIV